MRSTKLSLNRKIVKSKFNLKNKRAHNSKRTRRDINNANQYKFGTIQPGDRKYSDLLKLPDIVWGNIFKYSSMYDIYMFKSVFNVNVLLPPVMALVKDPHSFDMCDKRFDYRVTTIINPCIYSFKNKNFLDLYNEHVNLTVCDNKSKLGLFNREFLNPEYDYITFISLNNMIETNMDSYEIKSYSINVPENYSVVEYTYLCINDVLYGTRPLLNKFNFTTPLPFNCIIKQYLLIKSDMIEACVLDNKMPVNGCCEYYNANPNEYLCMDKKLTKDFVYYHHQVFY
uniref:Uncharacterized protein n=1 Tax=Anticarsia gemmatalis multiple nucleopolyhedrovirus TaxID=268591 RepID=A0A0S3IWZ9_9ABAC|nr:hypothetical protein AGNV_009 [Anticarsia gemmatalis multiple nucleopolyhedrovirus]ALR70289.1 hypothetical protein AGNV_009 [Anticarsia gemmatalis multiple nucleopolyhedrovirus]ALR70602.1 hypothetical protein AGNV_009 [Anticarsia gemmatalis multiple nucleopolyhedrovirus]AXE72193.1 hypothetical protein [Anticarsia gemmatalis multiple nucleopolyhedrovirus]